MSPIGMSRKGGHVSRLLKAGFAALVLVVASWP